MLRATEFNMKIAKAVWREEAREEGIEIGVKRERSYMRSLLKQGLSADEILRRIKN
jgi:hypothetical protein